MNDKHRFIVADVMVYFVAHLINFVYMFLVINSTPEFKFHWEQSDYVGSWILFVLATIVYIFVIVKYYKNFRKIGLGFIYSVITEILYSMIIISALTRPPYSEEWGALGFLVILFSFTVLPILFIIIAIIYFAVKKKKETNKSGE